MADGVKGLTDFLTADRQGVYPGPPQQSAAPAAGGIPRPVPRPNVGDQPYIDRKRKEIVDRINAGEAVLPEELAALRAAQPKTSALANYPKAAVAGGAEMAASVPKAGAMMQTRMEQAQKGRLDIIAAERAKVIESPRFKALPEKLQNEVLKDFDRKRAYLEDPIRNLGDDPAAPVRRPESRNLWRVGEEAEAAASGVLGAPDPARDPEFGANVARGAGQFGVMIPAGVAGGAGAAMALGSSQMAVAQFEDALEHKASLEDALRAGGLSSILGLTEAVPVLRALDRMGGGAILANVLKSAGEEAAQEFVQTVGENLIASDAVGYDKGRGTLEGTAMAAGVGGTVGGGMAAVLGAAAKVKRKRGVKLTPEEEEAEALAAIQAAEDARQALDPNAAAAREAEEARAVAAGEGAPRTVTPEAAAPQPQEQPAPVTAQPAEPAAPTEAPKPKPRPASGAATQPTADEDALPIAGAELDDTTGKPIDPTQQVFINRETGEVRPYGQEPEASPAQNDEAPPVETESAPSSTKNTEPDAPSEGDTVAQDDPRVEDFARDYEAGRVEEDALDEFDDADIVAIGQRLNVPDSDPDAIRARLAEKAGEDFGGGEALTERDPEAAAEREEDFTRWAKTPEAQNAGDSKAARARFKQQPKVAIRRIWREMTGAPVSGSAASIIRQIESAPLSEKQAQRLNYLIDRDVEANPRSKGAKGKTAPASVDKLAEGIRAGNADAVQRAARTPGQGGLSAADAKKLAKDITGRAYKTKGDAIEALGRFVRKGGQQAETAKAAPDDVVARMRRPDFTEAQRNAALDAVHEMPTAKAIAAVKEVTGVKHTSKRAAVEDFDAWTWKRFQARNTNEKLYNPETGTLAPATVSNQLKQSDPKAARRDDAKRRLAEKETREAEEREEAKRELKLKDQKGKGRVAATKGVAGFITRAVQRFHDQAPSNADIMIVSGADLDSAPAWARDAAESGIAEYEATLKGRADNGLRAFVKQAGPGRYVIYLPEGFSRHPRMRQMEYALHELGHIYEIEIFENAPAKTQRSLKAEWKRTNIQSNRDALERGWPVKIRQELWSLFREGGEQTKAPKSDAAQEWTARFEAHAKLDPKDPGIDTFPTMVDEFLSDQRISVSAQKRIIMAVTGYAKSLVGNHDNRRIALISWRRNKASDKYLFESRANQKSRFAKSPDGAPLLDEAADSYGMRQGAGDDALAFSEWFANQLSRTLSTSDTAIRSVEAETGRWWKQLASMWRKIANYLRGMRGPSGERYSNQRVEAWLNEVGIDTRLSKVREGDGMKATVVPPAQTEFTPRRTAAQEAQIEEDRARTNFGRMSQAERDRTRGAYAKGPSASNIQDPAAALSRLESQPKRAQQQIVRELAGDGVKLPRDAAGRVAWARESVTGADQAIDLNRAIDAVLGVETEAAPQEDMSAVRDDYQPSALQRMDIIKLRDLNKKARNSDEYRNVREEIEGRRQRKADDLKASGDYTAEQLADALSISVAAAEAEIKAEKRAAEISGQGASDAQPAGTDLERDLGDAGTPDSVGGADVSASAGVAGQGSGQRSDQDRAGDERSDGGERVSGSDAASVGAQGDRAVRGQDGGESDAAPDIRRSGDRSDKRPSSDELAATKAEKAASDRANVNDPAAGRLRRIAEADKVKVVPRDKANIAATLPLLQPVQRNDVLKQEDRIATAPNGETGMMFTNGTGTGKTFTGLGVVKRYAQQGKKNILIVAPSDKVLNDWKTTASDFFDLDVSILPDTKAAGEGIVATSYAALGSNEALADRDWDLIVADESHYLNNNKTGDPTGAQRAFRAISGHPDGVSQRARMQLRDEAAAVEKLESEAKTDIASDMDEIYRHGQELKDKAKKLDEQFRKNLKERTAELKGKPRSHAVFLSATPFAYDKNVDYAEGFLFSYPAESDGGYNSAGGREDFMQRHFGYRMRYNKLTQPDAEVDSSVMERAFHEHLKETGALSARALEVEADYERRFATLENAEGAKIDQALEWLATARGGRYRAIHQAVMDNFTFLKRRQLLEAIKAREIIPTITALRAEGRKVVVFHDYNVGGGFNPFKLTDKDGYNLNVNEEVDVGNGEMVKLGVLFGEFVGANKYVKGLNFTDYLPPVDALSQAFPDTLVFNGKQPKKERRARIEAFNEDGGDALLVVQSDAGAEGISLHDTSGQHKRVLINLGMPTRPTRATQIEGRIYRVGQVTDAMIVYPTTGSGWERAAFAGSIAERAATAENLAMGESARGLRDSFMEGYAEADVYEPGETDGRGGKERDRTAAKLTPWEKAKSFYYGQGKKKGRRDQREGIDYFATPEPVGLKMVELANAKFAEKILEPSAGHGAISRWFPEGTQKTVIEPSPDLSSRAALASPGAKVINSRFEDHNLVNKYDAIVMNPPFGSGGKTAIEHLAKAARHLKNGGRIVALIPTGPAADAKFEKFNEDPRAKDLHVVASIKLPTSTFERAGTSVSARIVVLEKHTDADVAAQIQQVNRDYSNAENINDLFDRMENLEIPTRLEPKTKEAEFPDRGDVTAGLAKFKLSNTKAGTAKARVVNISRVGFRETRRAADNHGGQFERNTFAFKTKEARTAFLQEVSELGEWTQSARTTVAPAAQTESSVKTGGVSFKTSETKHTKTGADQFIAALEGFQQREIFTQAKEAASRHGGFYSRFNRGFTFTTEAQRQAFLDDLSGSRPARFALAPGQRRQTETPEFKRWFGDSKVVDENGEPQVVYHGTKANFDAFESPDYEGGFFFSDRSDVAGHYALSFEGEGSIMPVYLSLQNPKVIDWKGVYGDARYNRTRMTSVLDLAEMEGHDGAIIKGMEDATEGGGETAQKQFVAFEPTQIKSATGNNGDFNPADGRIHFALAPVRTQLRTGTTAGSGTAQPNEAAYQALLQRNHQTLIGPPKGANRDPGAMLTWFDSVRAQRQDAFIAPLRMMQEAQRRRGSTVAESQNVYLQEKTYAGRVGDKMAEVQFELVEPTLQDIADAGISLQQLDEYLAAKHAPERNRQIARINPDMPDGGSGITTAEANATVAKYEADHGDTLRRINRRVRRIRVRALRWRVQAGLMTEAQAKAWLKAYKHYVPLKGWDDISNAPIDERVKRQGSGANQPIGGSQYTIKGGESRRALGRGAGNEAANPFVQFVTDVEESIIRGEKNQILLSTLELARAGDMTDFVEEIQVNNVRVYNPSTGLVEWQARNPLLAKEEDNHVTVKEDGKEKRIRIKDTDVALAFKNTANVRFEGAMRVLQAYSMYFSNANTSWNPAFMFVNMMRDIGTFAFTSPRFKVKGMRRAVMKHYLPSIKAAGRGIRGRYDGEYGRWFKRFQKAGGKISFFDIGGVESKAGQYRRKAAAQQGELRWKTINLSKGYQAVNAFADFVETGNLAMDNALRLSVFRAAVESGVSDMEAAAMARDVTVDFNKKGFKSSAMNAFFPFTNAAVQGTETLIRALKSPAVVRSMGALVALGFLQEILNGALGDGDDDEVLPYDKLNDYEYEHHAIIVTGSYAIKIPLQYGINIPFNLGRVMARTMRAMSGANLDWSAADAAKSVFGTVAEAFVPMYAGGDAGDFVGVDWGNTAAPTIIDPAVDSLENETFTGGSIRPENTFEKGPRAQKYYSNVSETSKAASEFFTWATGGNKHEAGAVDVSPEYFDHISTSLAGGAGAFVMRLINLGEKAATGTLDTVELRDIPIARRFVKEIGIFTDRSLAYDRMREVGEAMESVKSALADEVEAGRWSGPTVPITDDMLTSRGRIKTSVVRKFIQGATDEQVRQLGMTPGAVQQIKDGVDYGDAGGLYNTVGSRLAKLYKSGRVTEMLVPVELSEAGNIPAKAARAWLQTATEADTAALGLRDRTFYLARLEQGVLDVQKKLAGFRRARVKAEDLPNEERRVRLEELEAKEQEILDGWNRRVLRAILKGEKPQVVEDEAKAG